MEKFTTDRGKPGILYQGFKYRVYRESKARRTWHCTKKDCKAVVSSLDCGSFGCVFLLLLYMACRTDFTSSGNSSVESCLVISPIIILLGRSPGSSVAFETHEALQHYDMFSGQDEKMIHINNSETNIIMFSTETNLIGRSPGSSVAFLLHSCLTFSLCTVLSSGSA
jgi:hypothetical protein